MIKYVSKRSNGFFQYKRRIPGTDKIFVKSLKTKIYRDAVQKAKIINREFDKQLNIKEANLSLLEYIEMYQAKMRNEGCRDSTIKRAGQCFTNFLEYTLIKSIDDINMILLQKYINYRLTQVKTRTMKMEVMYIKSLCDYLIDLELMNRNPLSSWKPKKYKEADKEFDTPLSQKDIELLFEKLDSKWHLMAKFYLSTGIRKNEIINIKWKDVDFKKGTIRIYNKKTNNYSNKIRYVPIWNALENVLNNLSEIRLPENYLFFPIETSYYARERIVECFYRALVRIRKETEIRYTIKRFRHTAASWMAHVMKVDPVALRDILGHTSLKVTDIYTHTKQDDISKLTRRKNA